MRLTHARRLQLLVLAGSLPGLLVAGLFLGGWSLPVWGRLALVAAALGCLLWGLHGLALRVQHPLQTLANLLAALREGDFSFRARQPQEGDALGEVYRELNTLSGLLQQQRLRALEATALLRAVMEAIDVGIFAFDEEGILRLVNRAGAALLGRVPEALVGATAAELGLGEGLEGASPRLVDLAFPGRAGRFELRRGPFRQGGRPHSLLVLSDLTHTLREEERKAWQRLVRVLGHEINNSLAPIQSLAESLVRILEAQREDWQADTRQGLGIIAGRAQGLGRFMEAYTRLARLPEPRCADVALGPLVRKVAALEPRMIVAVADGPELQLRVDPDQLEQALINLVKNAVEAAQITGGSVTLGWSATALAVELCVEDEGPGLPEDANLFVPFFTTKTGGSGIGLLLSRQIAEQHGGSLTLVNRKDREGACAILRLPR